MESGGIGVRTVRDPVLAMYRWEVAVSAEPAKNLPLLTGQIINNISVALEYVAFQIYLIAGGEPDGPQAAKVAFPIVNTESPWDSVVKKKVPGVWPEAADRLKAAQPFSQEGMAANALRTLRGLGGTDKHRNLVLCAAVALSANVIGPAGGVGCQIRLARADGDISKGPVVPIKPGTVVEVACAFAQPSPAPDHDAVLLWASGVDFKLPPPPTVEYTFRANNGSEVDLPGLRGLIEHVLVIVDSFTDLSGPG